MWLLLMLRRRRCSWLAVGDGRLRVLPPAVGGEEDLLLLLVVGWVVLRVDGGAHICLVTAAAAGG